MGMRSREEIIEENKKLSARIDELIRKADLAQAGGYTEYMNQYDSELDRCRKMLRENNEELDSMEKESEEEER